MTNIKRYSILYGMDDKLKQLTDKKNKLDSFQPLPPELTTNLDEWFKIELTYTSNAIEGNTLSRAETALVVEKGITVEGKTLEEHLEAINHVLAIDFIKSLALKKRQDIKESDILEIHKLILTKIDDTNAGRYRSVPVRIAGSTAIMPNAVKVPELMKEFIEWLKKDSSDHPITISAQAHYKLVSIHPFTDGNGRTARLLMNLLLLQEGYPPAIIQKEERNKYINVIEKAQLGESLNDFLDLIYEAIDRSLDIYLEASQGILSSKTVKPINIGSINPNKPTRKDLKIGELAKATFETVHTLRFWTKIGLLQVKNLTKGGYQLYDTAMIERAREIRRLQIDLRLRLDEIKKRFLTSG